MSLVVLCPSVCDCSVLTPPHCHLHITRCLNQNCVRTTPCPAWRCVCMWLVAVRVPRATATRILQRTATVPVTDTRCPVTVRHAEAHPTLNVPCRCETTQTIQPHTGHRAATPQQPRRHRLVCDLVEGVLARCDRRWRSAFASTVQNVPCEAHLRECVSVHRGQALCKHMLCT